MSDQDMSDAVNKAAGTYDDVDEVLDSGTPEWDLCITFSGDAGETMDNCIDGLFKSFSADLYPEDGGEPVEAIIVGSDPDAEWYGTVRYRDHEDWEPVGPVKSMRTRRVHIH